MGQAIAELDEETEEEDEEDLELLVKDVVMEDLED